LVFAEIALKHNMIDVCINTLKSMDPNNVDTCNLLQKMYLETKCVQKNINYSTVSIICTLMIENVCIVFNFFKYSSNPISCYYVLIHQ